MPQDKSYYKSVFSQDLDLTGPIAGADEAEMVFILTFWEEDDLSFDFPMIASDFLKREADSLASYTDSPYFSEIMHHRGPVDGFKIKITSMMLSAARKGSAYAQELLRRIYKTYYKREYNTIKRFQTISYDELMAFENDSEIWTETCARILTIAPFFGITLDSSCAAAYRHIRKDVQETPDVYLTDPDLLEFPEGLFVENLDKAETLADWETFYSSKPRKLRDIIRFRQAVFRYFGVPEDYDFYVNREYRPRKQALAITLSILKMTFPKREFSDKEVFFYLEIFDQIKAYTSQNAILEDNVNVMLGMRDGYDYEEEVLRLKPFEADEAAADSRKRETESKVPTAIPLATDNVDDLRRENEELRVQLKRAKTNLKNASAELAESRRTVRELQAIEEKQEDLRKELQALREFAYQSTEQDIVIKEPDYAALEKLLRGKRIVIIGGHDNWISQLREKFPDWVFVKPGISGAVDVHVINHADAVYFFTDFISHSTYGKYVQYAREADISFRYIHSTNIRANIRQIAGDLESMSGGNS